MKRASTLESTLSDRLQQETTEAHRGIEKHPFLTLLIREELTPVQFFSHIVDLHLVYDSLEHALFSSQAKELRLKPFLFRELGRAKMLLKDMHAKEFYGFVRAPSLQGKAYAGHIESLAQISPLRLLAHAYVRYLGDLSGGMMLKTHVANQWPDAVHFYDFKDLLNECGVDSPGAFKALFKERLNALTLTPKEQSDLLMEANQAFQMSGKLFDAIVMPH